MQKKIIGIFICTLLIGTILPVTGIILNIDKKSLASINGIILYVGGSGEGNYSKIQDAINDSSDGDTVFVFNGTYKERVTVNKAIRLIGENKVNTIIDVYRIFIVVSKVSISGFTIQYGNGIHIEARHNSIDNNTISGNIFKSYEDQLGLGGVRIYNSSYNTISDNSFFNCGLYIIPYQNFIYNNTVNGKPLVYLLNTSDEVIDDAGQVFLIGCNNITVKNSELHNTPFGIQLIDSMNCIISDNMLSNIGLFGITFINSNNNIISGNIISNMIENVGMGLLLLVSESNTISKNSFNSISNLWLADSSCNIIEYNNFYYPNKRLNVVSLDSDNKWVGNFWNKPRLFPVLIWSYNPPRILPSSLDIDWRPAKEPNDINGAEKNWATLEVIMPRDRILSNTLFMRFFEQFPILKSLLRV